MRPIKFRAFDGKTMRYDVTGLEHGYKNEMAGVFIDGDYYYLKDAARSGTQAQLMQWTGLQDSKGVDIYEGDLIDSEQYPFVSDGLRNYRGVICWDEGTAGFWYDLVVISDRVRGSACGATLDELPEDVVVIGNRFEHPHLTEE